MALKIRLHCEGCIEKINKIILKIKGREINKHTKLIFFSYLQVKTKFNDAKYFMLLT